MKGKKERVSSRSTRSKTKAKAELQEKNEETILDNMVEDPSFPPQSPPYHQLVEPGSPQLNICKMFLPTARKQNLSTIRETAEHDQEQV